MAQRIGEPGEERLARPNHDPDRPSLSSREAADRIGVTSQAVIDGIRRGTIEGYYLPGRQRRRWFAYVTSVEAFQERRRPTSGHQELLQRIAWLENALTDERAAAEAEHESYLELQQVATQLAEINRSLLQANRKLTETNEHTRSFKRADWVPAYPPGGG